MLLVGDSSPSASPGHLRASKNRTLNPIIQVLHVGRSIPVCITLKNVIEKSFPEEYEARAEEEAHGGGGGPAGDTAHLPLFVMAPVLPGAWFFLASRCVVLLEKLFLKEFSWFLCAIGGSRDCSLKVCLSVLAEGLDGARFYISGFALGSSGASGTPTIIAPLLVVL